MEEYKNQQSKATEELIKSFPKKVEETQALIQQLFAQYELSKLREAFKIANTTNITVNQQLHECIITTTSEIQSLVSALRQIEQWIVLMVPKVSDGNNFGVAVQKHVYTHLKESLTSWQKAWDTIPDYYKERATAIEKLNTKISTESSNSTTTTVSKGGKDGDENKNVQTNVEKQESKSAPAIEDQVNYVTALDIKWFFNLGHMLEEVRDTYVTAFDIIEKNKEKLKKPRGDSDRAAYNSMF